MGFHGFPWVSMAFPSICPSTTPWKLGCTSVIRNNSPAARIREVWRAMVLYGLMIYRGIGAYPAIVPGIMWMSNAAGNLKRDWFCECPRGKLNQVLEPQNGDSERKYWHLGLLSNAPKKQNAKKREMSGGRPTLYPGPTRSAVACSGYACTRVYGKCTYLKYAIKEREREIPTVRY